MCCSMEMLKRIVPFVITFALGLFVASIFYGFTSGNSAKSYQFNSVEKSSKHSRTHCFGERKAMREDFEEDVIFLIPPPPPAPPAPPVAPTAPRNEIETTVFPPTPPETLVLPEEIRKPSNK